MTQMPFTPPPSVAPAPLKAHHGSLVLSLGIIGLALSTLFGCCCGVFCCCSIVPAALGVACGVAAWVVANSDLREMAAGRMDWSGQGLVKAGKVCGVIAVVVAVISVVVQVLILILNMVMPFALPNFFDGFNHHRHHYEGFEDVRHPLLS